MEPSSLTRPFQCLTILSSTRDFAQAAALCGLSGAEFDAAIDEIQLEFGPVILREGAAFKGFTPFGERVLAWSHAVVDESADLRSDIRGLQSEAAVARLIARRSVSPKRLAEPGPDGDQIDLMIQAAMCAPDHGGLHPWRIIEFRQPQRSALADLFELEKRRRDPLAPVTDLRRAREHATRSPVLVAFVVSPNWRSRVPVLEQWLAAGAALGNFMNAAHQLGFGAIVLSGERCFDRELTSALLLRGSESLAGFISIGTAVDEPPPRRQVQPGQVWSRWTPGLKTRLLSTHEQTRPG
jgi:nitroreductase